MCMGMANGGKTPKQCKHNSDEICVNADCPLVADYCPVPDTENVCQWEDRGE